MSVKDQILITSLVTGGILISGSMLAIAGEGPDEIELGSLSNIYEAVTFDHGMHEDIATCATCHHHTTGMAAEDTKCLPCHAASGEAAEVACSACHVTRPGNAEKIKESQAVNLYHTDSTGLKRAYHLKCMGCHEEMDAASGCEDCHPKPADHLKVSQTSK